MTILKKSYAANLNTIWKVAVFGKTQDCTSAAAS